MELDQLSTELKAFTGEAKGTLEKLNLSNNELSNRMLTLEQRVTSRADGGFAGDYGEKSLGSLVTESEAFKAMLSGGTKSTGQIRIGSFHKTAIVNATGQNQPLVPDMRVPGIVAPGQQRLTVRDLLPQGRTTSNLVQFSRELSHTSNAASQTGGSPNLGEGSVKGESAFTFELQNAPVETIAHWIPASRQIIEDSPMLQSYLNNRLTFLLKLEEERQLLSGSGAGNDLSGLINEADVFDGTTYGPVNPSTDTYLDVIRAAMLQVEDVAKVAADAVVLNPRDVARLDKIKTTSTAEYIFSSPHSRTSLTIWGLPIVSSPSMAESQFLVGNFQIAAQIWDRADATIEVSREHSDYFVRNLVAVLCEERLALTVYRPSALVYGGFPWGS
jgi:HK97 family phage major capsid protein